MELILVPFVIPLLLLGHFIDRLDRGQPTPAALPSSEEDWLCTWFALHGGPRAPKRKARSSSTITRSGSTPTATRPKLRPR